MFESIRDLLAGRPLAELAPSALLFAEVVTPFGRELDDEPVRSAWEKRAREEDELPGWFALGSKDTPNGTIWQVAFCPALPGQDSAAALSDRVLPEALWAYRVLSSQPSTIGTWHVRQTRSAHGVWVSLWEGERCQRLQGPFVPEAPAMIRELSWLERAHPALATAPDTPWKDPTTADLLSLSETYPEASLLLFEQAEKRRKAFEARRAWAILLVTLFCLGVVSAALGSVQMMAWWQLGREEARIATVRPLVDRLERLKESRQKELHSVRMQQALLAPNTRAAQVLQALAKAVPGDVRLGGWIQEAKGLPWQGQWTARSEARVPDWNSIRPLVESLRSMPGLTAVKVQQQSMQSGRVSVVLTLEGKW